MHFVMQHINLEKTASYKEIKSQVEELRVKGFITEEEEKVINISKILGFFTSTLGGRMRRSCNVQREFPFFMEVSSTDIYKDIPKDTYKDEKVLIQGIIDCYFEEEDYIVLLDYKTDYVESTQSIKERYNLQMEYYAKALERITKKKVKYRYIYLFYSGEIVEF